MNKEELVKSYGKRGELLEKIKLCNERSKSLESKEVKINNDLVCARDNHVLSGPVYYDEIRDAQGFECDIEAYQICEVCGKKVYRSSLESVKGR